MPFTADDTEHCTHNLVASVNSYTASNMPIEQRREILSAAKALIVAVEDPQQSAFNIAMASCTHAAVQSASGMGLFSAYAEGQDVITMTSDQLAHKTGASSQLVTRIMRALVAIGVFQEEEPQSYSRNRLFKSFTTPPSSDLMLTTASRMWKDMAQLPAYLASIDYRNPGESSTDPTVFQYWNQTELDYWKWLDEHPDPLDAFNRTMTRKVGIERKNYLEGVASIYPFDELGKNISPEEVLLVDVGGGRGQILDDIHKSLPDLNGRFILKDRQNTLEGRICSDDIELVTYDFFQPQPITGARAYIFCHILHDWPDREAGKILLNTIPALAKGRSRILIVERVLPNRNCSLSDANWDLIMMRTSEKERMESQWKLLLQSVGLKIIKFWSSDIEDKIIEVVPVHWES